MTIKDALIGLAALVLFYWGSNYLYQGQEESTAFYAKRHTPANTTQK
jgi:hypothetical protein